MRREASGPSNSFFHSSITGGMDGVGECIAFAFVIAIIEQPQIDMVKIAGHHPDQPISGANG